MKKSAIALLLPALLFSAMAQAADWTPMFSYLEKGKTGDRGKAFAAFAGSVAHYTEDPNCPITDGCDYRRSLSKTYKLSKPYANDALPARNVTSRELGEEVEDNGIYTPAYVPVKNATLYGHKIHGFILWEYPGTDNVGSYVDFGPMSKAQFTKLNKKVYFKKLPEDYEVEYAAEFTYKKGRVLLHIEY
ncbi:hypothetical protein ACFBZI_11310 [Moraxella sp. ZJ142]|uniref:hypothetical protein n=1 Tax=Moraxella marmotae TaxID=3344520 RepID=UPI0035D4C71F